VRPEEVLDHQAEMIDRLTQPFFSEMISSTIREQYVSEVSLSEEEWAGALVALPAVLGRTLRSSYAYHVTADMAEVVMGAAAGLDELDRWLPQLAPSPHGFARIEGGFPIDDARGRQMRVDWIVWGPVRTIDGEAATGLWLFNDQYDDPDAISRSIWERHGREAVLRETGRWGFIGLDLQAEEGRMGPAYVMPDSEHAERIRADGATPHAFSRPHRCVYALWLLLGQTLTSVTEADIPRSFAKRAIRKSLPPRVTVIRLRRRSGASTGENLVDWACRWLVREHRRWQPYGSHGASPLCEGAGGEAAPADPARLRPHPVVNPA
jgi:hypothetical protein